MSIEYIFLNEALRDRFMRFLGDIGVASSARQDEMDAFLAEVPDELDDELSETIEDEYEMLMKEQDGLFEAEEGWLSQDVMGVPCTLADGTTCVIRIPGDIARRLGEHFTPEEIRELVAVIVDGVENPVDGPLCKIA